MNGIEKEVDDLGRVVIPIKFRKKLGIVSKAKVTVCIDDDTILISATNRICALCGSDINRVRELRICDKCIDKIKSNY